MYPYNLRLTETHSCFGDQLRGDGLFLGLDDSSPVLDEINIADQSALQAYADQKLLEAGTNWAISAFGEPRERMFRALDCDQMVGEGRFYHLGVDFWLPAGSNIYAPLGGTIVESGYESGFGNYGGFVCVKHSQFNKPIYTFYGHLDPVTVLEVGQVITSGDVIGKLGNMQNNGGYFYHLHLQVLTESGYEAGFAHKGYATKKQFSEIDSYVLDSSYFLFLK